MKTITLQRQFRLWTVLLILIPSLLIMGVYTIVQIQIGKQKSLELIAQRVNSQEYLLNQWATERMDNVRQLSRLEAFRTLDYDKMNDILFLMQHSNSNFSSLAYVDKDGIFKIFTLETGKQHLLMLGKYTSLKNSAKYEFFSGIVIGRSSGVPIIHFSAPIYDAAGNFQGSVLGGIKTSKLAPLLQENWIGETGEIRLVNEQGYLLTEPRNADLLITKGVYTGSAILKIKMSDAALEKITLGQSGTATWTDRTNKKVLSAYQSMPAYGWTLIGKINEDEILEPIYEQLLTMGIITLLLIFLFLPLSTLLTNRIKRPLEWLIEQSKLVASTNDEVITPYQPAKNTSYELKVLCETFTTLQHNIKNTVRTLKENEITLEQKVYERTLELSDLNKILEKEMVKHQATNAALKLSHTELLISERQYKDLFEHMHNGCACYKLIFDAEGSPFDFEIIDVNRTYEEHAGYLASELIGKKVTDIFPRLQEESFDWMGTLIKVAISGEPTNFTTYSSYQNRWYQIAAYSPERGYVATIGEDITHYIALKKEVDRTDRLNLIGNVAAGLAHEIRNPLTVIKGYLQYFKKKLPNYLHEQCDLVLSELGRIEAIITVFLSIAKNKPTELAEQDLNEIINTVAPLLVADASKRSMNIEFKLSPQISKLLLSKKEVKQLILNIAMNGLAAMQEHGTLTIETKEQGSKTILSITDSGSGIPSALQHKIFDPFFTTHSGTGLGLSVCTSIAERHNAIIDVFSEEGKGTCFTIIFEKDKIVNLKKQSSNSLYETW